MSVTPLAVFLTDIRNTPSPALRAPSKVQKYVMVSVSGHSSENFKDDAESCKRDVTCVREYSDCYGRFPKDAGARASDG